MNVLIVGLQTIAGLLLVLIGLWITTFIFDLIYPRIRAIQKDNLILKTKRALALTKIQHAQVQQIHANEAGRMPLLIGNDPRLGVVDPLTLRAFNLLGEVLEIHPDLEQAQTMIQLAQALPSGNGQHLQELMKTAEIPSPWPATPQLVDVMRSRSASLSSLILGQLKSGELITRSIHAMMHTLAIAATHHGKSAWIQSLIYQVALSPEPIEVVAVDIHGSAFNVIADWNKLRYPVAKTREEAQDVFQSALEELERRQKLYMTCPTATDLIGYNRVAETPLPIWWLLIDEGTILMNEAGMQTPVRELVQGGRQYGFYITLTGQSAHHKVVETQIRDQFRTRWVGWTSVHSARAALGVTELPGEIPVQKGRAWMQLDSGRTTELIQGLYVSPEQLLQAIQTGGPAKTFPRIETSLDETEEMRSLSRQGFQPAEILKRVRGRRPNGRDYKALSEALQA